MRTIVITHLKNARVTALSEDDRIVSMLLSDKDDCYSIGDVYIGRVNQVKPDISAAFIDIAPGEACYMAIEPKRSIKSGELLPVQIQKPAGRGKRIRVTDRLSLDGRYLVVTEGTKPAGVSLKITSEARREELKELATRIAASEEGRGFSYIFRTNAAEADEADMINEANALSAELRQLRGAAPFQALYSKLRGSEPDYLSLIRDTEDRSLKKVITDDKAVYDSVVSHFQDREINAELYSDELLPLSKLYNIEYTIKDAFRRKIWLRSGGFIVIDHTEALTVIDVNTGKSDSNSSTEKTFLRINTEAAEKIAFELRLRNISGIIIVDFIDMQTQENKDALSAKIRTEIAKDPVRTTFHGMTNLGLAELTRKKLRAPLYEDAMRFGLTEKIQKPLD